MLDRIFLAALAVLFLAVPGRAADAPPPFAEFTFKRVAPPSGDTRRRITVQIVPAPPAPPAPPSAAAPEEEAPGAGPAAAFWAAVSPRLEDASPARLEPSLAALTGVPGVPAPRLDEMRRITRAYGREILRATVGTEVSPALVAAVISVESSGRADAVSSAGARGVMQLMPATAARFGVDSPEDPAQNIRGGVAYLEFLMGEFSRDPVMILAGYNAGEGAVRKHGGVPPYAETRHYVPKVLAAWQVASGLCKTPPMLISDGCVFID